MDNFYVMEVIRRGKYFTVYKGMKKENFNIYAIKSVDKSHKSTVLHEVRILQSLDHCNVVKFYAWYENFAELWLVLEYCGGGDLRALLRMAGGLPEDSVRVIACDVVSGLSCLHSKGIIHGDLKPSSILFDGNGCIKLCDFGLSKELSDISKTPLSSEVGEGNKRRSPCYMAPELFDDGGVHSYASDLWALGCVMYECYAGRPPFLGKEPTEIVESILTDPTPSLPGNPSRPFAELVSCLLIKDPTARIQFSEVCTHAFWKTHFLPPQAAFHNQNQNPTEEGNPENKTKTPPEGVNPCIAESNLQRESGKRNDIPTTDEKLSMADQEERLIQHEIGSSPSIAMNTDDDDSGGEAVNPAEVLWHESDLLVLPVIPLPSPKSDEHQKGILRSLSFGTSAVSFSDVLESPKDHLEGVIELIATILKKKKKNEEQKNVISYLELLSTNVAAANILTTSSIIPILVQMLQRSKASALRLQLASLLGLLLRHSTLFNAELMKSGILEVLRRSLVDPKETKEVRRMSMAALGQLLFCISRHSKATSAPESPWKVPDTLISVVTSLLGRGEDDKTQLYALRTIENMSSLGGYWSTCFTTHDVVNNLCHIFRDPGKEETVRLAAGSCLVRLVRFTPPTIEQVMKLLTFKELAVSISKQSSRNRNQICLNMLNMALLDSDRFPDLGHRLLLLAEDEDLVLNIAYLVVHGGEVLCGKSLLFIRLLCETEAGMLWLGQFFLVGKLLPTVETLVVNVKEKEAVGYLPECVEVVSGVLRLIPKLMETVIHSFSQLIDGDSKMETYLQLFPVVDRFLMRSFIHKLLNAGLLQQLMRLVKLNSLSFDFQGRDNLERTLVGMLETIAYEESLMKQHRSIFLEHILPHVSMICRRNGDGETRFACLRIWFRVVVEMIDESAPGYEEELRPVCDEHFLPLYPKLLEMKDVEQIPLYAEKLRYRMAYAEIA